MNNHLLNKIDVLIVPIVFIIIWIIGLMFKKGQPENIQKYFSKALLIRFIGTLGIAAISEFNV